LLKGLYIGRGGNFTSRGGGRKRKKLVHSIRGPHYYEPTWESYLLRAKKEEGITGSLGAWRVQLKFDGERNTAILLQRIPVGALRGLFAGEFFKSRRERKRREQVGS